MCRHFGSNSTSSVLIVVYVRNYGSHFGHFMVPEWLLKEPESWVEVGRLSLVAHMILQLVAHATDRHLESS